uniref:Uncharacterized protein n=1 Tax=Falco tinnunculus TaxID=100819 RepID=A0A8C4V7Q0_FALTI
MVNLHLLTFMKLQSFHIRSQESSKVYLLQPLRQNVKFNRRLQTTLVLVQSCSIGLDGSPCPPKNKGVF